MKNKPAKKKPGEKLNNISPEYDSTREQTVLLEDMHKDIKAIAEQHNGIVERLDKIDEKLQKLDNIESELKTVETATIDDSRRIKALEAGQQRMEQKLDITIADHEQRIGKLDP